MRLLILSFLLHCFVFAQVSSRTLMVLCQPEFIRITVLLDEPNFFGLIYTRPDRNSCSVWGSGEREINLFIPLLEPGRSKCGVIAQNAYYTAVIDVRRHHIVEMADDSSFIIQCSANEIGEPSNTPKAHMALDLLKDDNSVRQTTVGQNYIMELQLPNNNFFHVTACLAFTGGDVIKIIPLTDDKGCPIDATVTTPFYPKENSDRVRAEITMFRFNDSNDIYLQCMVAQCRNECKRPFCKPPQDANNLLSTQKVLAQNRIEAMTATRVTVMDTSGFQKLIETYPCIIAADSSLVSLILLLSSLVMLTSISSVFAFYNRPFRCHIYPRDETLTSKTNYEKPKLTSVKLLPFPLLSLPPSSQIMNKNILKISPVSSIGIPPELDLEEKTEKVEDITIRSINSNSTLNSVERPQSNPLTNTAATLDTPFPPKYPRKKRPPTPPPRSDSYKGSSPSGSFPTPPPPLKLTDLNGEVSDQEPFPPPPGAMASSNRRNKQKPTPPPRTVYAQLQQTDSMSDQGGYVTPDVKKPILQGSNTLDRPLPKARKVANGSWFFDV